MYDMVAAILRNSAYMRFRRYHFWFRSQLQNVTTFRNQWKALNHFEPLSVPGLDDTFQVDNQLKPRLLISRQTPLADWRLWLAILFAG